MATRKPPLPKAVREHLAVVEDRLRQVATGTPPGEVVADLDRAFEAAFNVAAAQGREAPGTHRYVASIVDYGSIVAANVRSLRDDVGWTQAQVAEAMTRVGFDWKRITVAEVEGGGRRLALEELLALAALYAIPMALLLFPRVQGDYLRWPGRALDPGDVHDLVLGTGGQTGDAGADWLPALHATGARSGAKDWRPAREFWRRRQLGYSQTGGGR